MVVTSCESDDGRLSKVFCKGRRYLCILWSL